MKDFRALWKGDANWSSEQTHFITYVPTMRSIWRDAKKRVKASDLVSLVSNEENPKKFQCQPDKLDVCHRKNFTDQNEHKNLAESVN